MHLIFDFDGTLVDSFRIVIDKFNLLADEFDFRKIHSDEIAQLRNLTSKELVRHLAIPIYKLPRVLHRAREHMRHDMHTLPSFLNLPDVLVELHRLDFSLGILTSNSSENVLAWLHQHHLRHLFSFIHAGSSFFGKTYQLKKICNTYQMDKMKTCYIGDETRDIEAAKECHIYSMAVAWGFNSEKMLAHHEPNYLARTPEDILTMANEIRKYP